MQNPLESFFAEHPNLLPLVRFLAAGSAPIVMYLDAAMASHQIVPWNAAEALWAGLKLSVMATIPALLIPTGVTRKLPDGLHHDEVTIVSKEDGSTWDEQTKTWVPAKP